MDIGLRWEIRLSPNTPSNNILVPNQPIVAGGAPSNSINWVPGSLFKNQLGNLGPSLGFAWDPFGTGKTSIRGNYRIAYDRINDFVIASTILPNLPGAAYAAINTSFRTSWRTPFQSPRVNGSKHHQHPTRALSERYQHRYRSQS